MSCRRRPEAVRAEEDDVGGLERSIGTRRRRAPRRSSRRSSGPAGCRSAQAHPGTAQLVDTPDEVPSSRTRPARRFRPRASADASRRSAQDIRLADERSARVSTVRCQGRGRRNARPPSRPGSAASASPRRSSPARASTRPRRGWPAAPGSSSSRSWAAGWFSREPTSRATVSVPSDGDRIQPCVAGGDANRRAAGSRPSASDETRIELANRHRPRRIGGRSDRMPEGRERIASSPQVSGSSGGTR